MSVTANDSPILRITHLTKYFGATVALDDVALDVLGGEIHGLVGQNGSGKSTIIKCLSGYHSQDLRWRLELGGDVLTRPLHPGEIASYGISFVHQDLGVLPELSVLENLLLIEMAESDRPYISWSKERRRAKRIFENFGISLDPGTILSTLRPVEQAQVAIIRAVMQLQEAKHAKGRRGILVLDEATTFLDQHGREGVHGLLRSVTSEGDGVIFVSHDIGEILSVTDRVTVLRDGRVVDTSPTRDLTHDDVVSLIVSGAKSAGVARQDQLVADPAQFAAVSTDGSGDARAQDHSKVLKLESMSGEYVEDVSIKASGGQIVGITGIVGSGWEFVLEYAFGASRATGGFIEVGGRRHRLDTMTPNLATQMSMAFVPSERLTHGIISELSVQENLMQPVLRRLFKKGFLRLRELASQCASILRRYGIVPQNPMLPMSALSGGNQQKALIVKWLQTNPDYVLLSDPTQGVDVGARRRIYELIRSAANRGSVVLYASSDWDEIAQVSDRVVVMADGRISKELEGDAVSSDAIARAAYVGSRTSADLSKGASAWEQL